jgi:two-component system catabolic regulation response regulator CreB
MLEGRGQKILIVDPDRTVLELLQIRLELAGYRAHLARSSTIALDMLKHLRPAAMIVHAKLDHMDGYDLIRTVRIRHTDATGPILLTGRSLTAEDVRRALNFGAQSAMLKPFSGSEVVERVGRLLSAKPPIAPHAPAAPSVTRRPAAFEKRDDVVLF